MGPAAGGKLQMDFPADPPSDAPERTVAVCLALGLEPSLIRFVGRGKFDLLVEAESLVGLSPDMSALKALGSRGVVVTAAAPTTAPARYPCGLDFVSRCFFPAVGVPEDPVTGSAHCMLAPYWAGKLGKHELSAWQASERGGWLGLTLAEDRVLIQGGAVTIMEGSLRV